MSNSAVDLYNQEETVGKLQGIIDAINGLQLQIDLQRAALIETLGGEPAMLGQTLNVEGHIPRYDSAGKLISGSSLSHLSGQTYTTGLKVGAGNDIAGATALVNGSLVIGDGAGGSGISLYCDRLKAQRITLADNTALKLAAPTEGVLHIYPVYSAHLEIYGTIGYRTGQCFAFLAGADVDTTTGVLSGTTGSDGSFTVSKDTSGLYVENRIGATTIFTYFILSGV